MSALDTSGVLRSIRHLLGLGALRGFVALRGEAAPVEVTHFSTAVDFRAGRARLLREREAELLALRADINAMLEASRRQRGR